MTAPSDPRAQVLAEFERALAELPDDDLVTLADAGDLQDIISTVLEISLADLSGIVTAGDK